MSADPAAVRMLRVAASLLVKSLSDRLWRLGKPRRWKRRGQMAKSVVPAVCAMLCLKTNSQTGSDLAEQITSTTLGCYRLQKHLVKR
jgi:hypothetical protein